MKQALSLSLSFGVVLAALVGLARAQDQVAPTVAVVDTRSYGPILTDSGGWTLYRWERDEPGESYCYDQCARVWLPMLIDGDPVAPQGLVGTLGVAARDDGTWQVTYNDWPLYYYVRDTQPGETSGQGSASFGAIWSVLSPAMALAPVELPPASPTPAPATPQATATPRPTSTSGPIAATVAVTIVDFQFRPGSVSLRVGDTLSWTNNGPSPHTATSDTGVWDTGRLGPGTSGSFTFTTAGSFAYHCAVHPSMRASVTVGAAATGGETQPTPGPQAAPASGSYGSFGSPGTGYIGYGGYGYPTMGYGGYGSTGMGYMGYGYSGMRYGGYMGGYPYSPSGYQYPPMPPPIGIALAAPIGLTVTGTTSTTVTLMWVATPGAASYRVYQALGGIGPTSVSAVTAPTNTGAMVTGLMPNTTYAFHVHAVDALGNLSPPSNIVVARTAP